MIKIKKFELKSNASTIQYFFNYTYTFRTLNSLGQEDDSGVVNPYDPEFVANNYPNDGNNDGNIGINNENAENNVGVGVGIQHDGQNEND